MRTINDALTDLATEMGYDGDDPTSIKDAVLDIADTLAGEDTGDAETVAAAIDILAQYVDEGGGGVSLGPLVVLQSCGDEPVVGGNADDCFDGPGNNITSLYVGETAIMDVSLVDTDSEQCPPVLASGITVTTRWDGELVDASGYIVTKEWSEAQSGYVYATVTSWNGVSVETETYDEGGYTYTHKRYVFTIPELDEDEILMLRVRFT